MALGRNDTDAGGDGACQAMAGAPMRTSTNSTHYSRFGYVVKKARRRLEDDGFIATKLNWQNQVSKDKEKQKGFQETVLQSLGFWPFLFMTKESYL